MVSLMLPYSISLLILWSLWLLLYWATGLPLGLGSTYVY
jgi:p-aminobenzoyl-glutamate transporter AbgT